MAGLDPAIHVLPPALFLTWMPGASPGMTDGGSANKKSRGAFAASAFL
jgi:hypothetical protein